MPSNEGGGASRSTDPAAGSSAATDVSLREFLMAQIVSAERRSEARFLAMELAVTDAFAGAQKAIDKADAATEKRFEGVNEFRAQLADQAGRFATRELVETLVDKLEVQINRNRDDLDALAKRIDLREGQAVGSKVTIGTLVTVITVAVLVIGVIVGLANYFANH